VLREHTGDDDLVVASFMATGPGLSSGTPSGCWRTWSCCGHGSAARTTSARYSVAFTRRRWTRFDISDWPYQLLRGRHARRVRPQPDDVMFQLVPQLPAPLRIAGTEAEIVVTDQLGSRFECEFQLYPQARRAAAVLCYDRARLDDDFAARLVSDYRGHGAAGGQLSKARSRSALIAASRDRH